VKLAVHLHLVPRIRRRGAIPPLPILLHATVFNQAQGYLFTIITLPRRSLKPGHQQIFTAQNIVLGFIRSRLYCSVSLRHVSTSPGRYHYGSALRVYSGDSNHFQDTRYPDRGFSWFPSISRGECKVQKHNSSDVCTLK
jgi:hypothetical protein